MKSLVAFIGLLLVVQFVENISGEVIHARIGDRVRLSGRKLINAVLVQCSVEHNGIEYSLYPLAKIIAQFEVNASSTFCEIDMNLINLDRAGEWNIRTIWNDTDAHNHNSPAATSIQQSLYSKNTLYIKETDNELISKNFVHGKNGNYANVYFKNDSDNITMCYIAKVGYHNGTIYILSDNGNGTSAGLKLYEKCGVQIPINDEWSGDWELIQQSGDYLLRTGNFTIVSNPKISPFEDSHEVWHRGSIHIKIDMKKYGANSYCEVEKPDGEVIPLINSDCELYLDEKVDNKHAGIWKLRYFSELSMYIIERRIVVHVFDPKVINATVTTTKDNIIHILCQTYVNKIDFCFFTNPNRTMIKASPGFGDQKYVYYGAGHYSMYGTDFAQCGITILQPSSDDNGLWECTITNPDSREIMRSFTAVTHL